MKKKVKKEISVIGLGYVGLPLAIEFGKKNKVVGFDLNKIRIKELRRGKDSTKECTKRQIVSSSAFISGDCSTSSPMSSL